MKKVFADAAYWIAVLSSKDQWSNSAKLARESLGDAGLVTTDEVLAELLTFANNRQKMGQQAAKLVRSILTNPRIEVKPQSRNSFLRGLVLYESRPDKDYSLTDCISMNTMKATGVTDVLTNDHHFAQEGFTILMPNLK